MGRVHEPSEGSIEVQLGLALSGRTGEIHLCRSAHSTDGSIRLTGSNCRPRSGSDGRGGDASTAVDHMAPWCSTSEMAVGGMTKRPRGGTGRAGRSRASEPAHLRRTTLRSSPPRWYWPLPTSITIRATTDRAISRHSASVAICCMTVTNTVAAAGSRFDGGKRWAICSSDAIPILPERRRA